MNLKSLNSRVRIYIPVAVNIKNVNIGTIETCFDNIQSNWQERLNIVSFEVNRKCPPHKLQKYASSSKKFQSYKTNWTRFLIFFFIADEIYYSEVACIFFFLFYRPKTQLFCNLLPLYIILHYTFSTQRCRT